MPSLSSNPVSAASTFGNFTPQPTAGNEDDYDAEEQTLIQQAEERQRQIMQRVSDLQQEELRQKNERRKKGSQALAEWKTQRQQQIALRQKNNLSEQEASAKHAAELKVSMNPWQRVCANVDFSGASALTVSGKDISRMKQAMLTRKADLTQEQASKPML